MIDRGLEELAESIQLLKNGVIGAMGRWFLSYFTCTLGFRCSFTYGPLGPFLGFGEACGGDREQQGAAVLEK